MTNASTKLHKIKQDYTIEAQSLLSDIEELLLNYDQQSIHFQDYHENLLRLFHTLKSGAYFAGFQKMGDLLHQIEFTLNHYLQFQIKYPKTLITHLFEAVDQLRKVIQDHDESILESLGQHFKSNPTQMVQFSFQFAVNIFETGSDPILLVKEFLKSGHPIQTKFSENLPGADQFDPYQCYGRWSGKLVTEKSIEELEEIFCFLSPENQIKIQAQDTQIELKDTKSTLAEIPTVQMDQIVKIDRQKLDKILLLTEEMISSKSEIQYHIENQLQSAALLNNTAFTTMDNTSRMLQQELQQLRLDCLDKLFQKFQRMIYDLNAAASNKQVNLKISGAEVELDRVIIEGISTPLLHLIRNAYDHGIESKTERKVKQKLPTGTISIKAYETQGNIYIEIRDDGKGINLENLRNKAIQNNLISADAELSSTELLDLIFAPGFSTREEISELSGRGFGLNIVKKELQKVSGSIHVKTEVDKGTIFTIQLPLTTAVLDGLLVKCGETVFVIPILSVIRSVSLNQSNFKNLNREEKVLLYNDDYISCVSLKKRFDLKDTYTEKMAIIIGNTKQTMAFLVEDILNNQQIVFKNVSKNYQDIKGVSGAFIMPNAQVAYIIDVTHILSETSTALNATLATC